MKLSLRLFLAMFFLALYLPSMAQCRFTARVVSSTGCNGIEGGVALGCAKAECEHVSSVIYNSPDECLAARKSILEWNNNKEYCHIIVNASPCKCSGETNNGYVYDDSPATDNGSFSNLDSYYNDQHRKVDNKATVGFDKMMETNPVGTERMMSGYIPSSAPSVPKISSIAPKQRSGRTVSLTLTGREHSSLNSDWNQYMLKNLAMEKVELKPVQFDRKTEKYMKDLEGKLDSGQMHMLKYYLKSNNHNEMPIALGRIDKNGRYVFESEDGMRVFSVSSNGRHLMIATFDTHSWNDENIIKKIQEGSFEQYLRESVGINGVFKNGEFTWDEWKGKPAEEIATKLPKIKAEIKMSLFDNSSNLAVQYYYLMPQKLGNMVVGSKAELSGGGKAEASVGAKPSDMGGYYANKKIDESLSGMFEFDYFGEKRKKEDDDLSYGSYKVGVETAKVSAAVTAGRVYSRGGKYILCTGEATASASLMIDIKTFFSPASVIRPGTSYGVSCKDITNP